MSIHQIRSIFLVAFAATGYSAMQAADPVKISQRNIPVTINCSGKYELCQDITFGGSGPAITINADNVQLNLAARNITLTNANATGIKVNSGFSEFVIENDAITNTAPRENQKGTGIVVEGARKGLIKNVFTVNNLNGLTISNSTDIRVINSQFFNATNAGAQVTSSVDVVFDTCVFDQCVNGLLFNSVGDITTSSRDCRVLNCSFPSSKLSNLLVQQMIGMVVDKCTFSEAGVQPGVSSAKANLVQFGDAVKDDQSCFDVIFTNNTIVNKSNNKAPEGLGIYQGSGFLVESCVIEIDNTGQDQSLDLSGIHISNPGLGTKASNVIIRDCVVQGPATNGFYPDVGTTGVIIDGCLAAGALKDGIFLAGTSNSTVTNNTVVNNGTNGIFIGEASPSNAINNNVVNGNGTSLVIDSLMPQGNGISIQTDDTASTKNTIQFNEVFSNAVYGIDDESTANNRIYNNTSYANGTANYKNVSPIVNPGDQAKAGQNIDGGL